MSAKHNENQTNRDINRRDVPKREPARTLWLCDLSEWKEFQAGELSAEELKRRYAGVSTEQADISDFTGGDGE